MRTITIMAAGLLLTAYAAAQQSRFVSAPSPSAPIIHQEKLSFARPAYDDSASRRRWYWETADPIAVPAAPTTATVVSSNLDFSPVTVSWNLSGKHKLVPSLEVVGFEISRGDGKRAVNQEPQFVSALSNRLWNRAGHAIMSALHN